MSAGAPGAASRSRAKVSRSDRSAPFSPRIGIEKGAGFGSRRRSAERGDRISVASKEDFHARRAFGRGGGESARAKLLFQRKQHALDMLARPKTVDAMVDAAAGIGPACEIADLDII